MVSPVYLGLGKYAELQRKKKPPSPCFNIFVSAVERPYDFMWVLLDGSSSNFNFLDPHELSIAINVTVGIPIVSHTK